MASSDTRRLGTESGRMRREARRIERAGGNPSRMLEAASEQKLREGSAISSAEGNMRREQYMNRLQRGQAELARRSILGSTDSAPAPTPSSGGGLSRAPISGSGAYRNDRGSSLGWIGGAAPNQGLSRQPTGGIVGPPEPGRIDGVRAEDRLASMRRDSNTTGYVPPFGKDIAKQNIDKLGLDGAISDYQRRSTENPGLKTNPDYSISDVLRTPVTGPQQSISDTPIQQSIAASAARRTPVPPTGSAPPLVTRPVSQPVATRSAITTPQSASLQRQTTRDAEVRKNLTARDQRNSAKKRPLPYRETSDNYTAPIGHQLSNTGTKILNWLEKERL